MRRPDPNRPEERGAALLTVLLLVAVMAVVAATALERVALATRMTGNGGAVDQGSALTWVRSQSQATPSCSRQGRMAATSLSMGSSVASRRTVSPG